MLHKIWLQVVIIVGLVVLLAGTVEMASEAGRGQTELQLRWEGPRGTEDCRSKTSGCSLHQELTLHLDWAGKNAWLPSTFFCEWEKQAGGDFTPQAAAVIWEREATISRLRVFLNKGWRSSREPMGFLASSRRAEQAGGIEVETRHGPLWARGLWVSEVDNTGDNGPLLFLTTSLASSSWPGVYRYWYMTHDSGPVLHLPVSGAYTTRTARHLHAVAGTWHLSPRVRLTTQVACLKGVDVRKEYVRQLSGWALLARGDGSLGKILWETEIYASNNGFDLCTGDSGSLAAGKQGWWLQAKRRWAKRQSLTLRLGIEREEDPAYEQVASPTEGGSETTFRGNLGVTYGRRQRWGKWRIAVDWDELPYTFLPQWAGEVGLRRWDLKLGGKLGATATPRLYLKLLPLSFLTASLQYSPAARCWRTAVQMVGEVGNIPGQWLLEGAYKQRPSGTYTYMRFVHKMQKGYWGVTLGKPDKGHLDWSWDEPPRVTLEMGREF